MSEDPEWGRLNPNYSEETPIIGNGRSFGDILQRAHFGAAPLLIYGVVGGAIMSTLAYGDAQIPLAGGFTLETPWSSPPNFYDAGEIGQSQDFQYREFLAGQPVFGPIRTHTTGLLDYGVRHGDHLAMLANDLVHPGRKEMLFREMDYEQMSLVRGSDAVGIPEARGRNTEALVPSVSSDNRVLASYSTVPFINRRRRRKMIDDLILIPDWSS